MKQKQHQHQPKWKGRKNVENPQNKILKYALERCENVNEIEKERERVSERQSEKAKKYIEVVEVFK